MQPAPDAAPSRCPKCGAAINAVVPADPALREKGPILPKPGDVTICLDCATPLIFTKDMTRREMTRVDFDRLSVDDRVAIRLQTREIHRKKIAGDRR